MGALFGILAAFGIGGGEHVGSRLVDRVRPEVITAAYLLAGVGVAVVLVLAMRPQFIAGDIGYGAASGLFNAFALLFLYRSYRVAPIGIALPITGVFIAVVPVLFDVVVDGAELSGLVVLGVVLGVCSLVLTTFDPGGEGRTSLGIAFGVGSGIFYGASVTLVGRTDEASGVWPLLPQRVVAVAVMLVVAARTGSDLLPSRADRVAYVPGLLGSLGLALFIIGSQRGSLTAAAVSSAQYPAVAIALGFLIYGTKVRWWQALGLIGAGIGVALVAAG